MSDCLQGEGLDHTCATVRIYDGQCQASQSCEEMSKEQSKMRMPVPKQSRDAVYGKESCSCFSAAVTPTLLTMSLLQLVQRAGVVRAFSSAVTPLTDSTEQKGGRVQP